MCGDFSQACRAELEKASLMTISVRVCRTIIEAFAQEPPDIDGEAADNMGAAGCSSS